MEIIDAHAHIYPQKIADKATMAIGKFYDIKMQMKSGTPERLCEDGKRAGISRFVVHSCATKPEQVRAINDFIAKETTEHKEFIGFMTLHQDLSEEQVFAEIDRCARMGFYGIKLHPDFQKFYIDEEKAEKIYRAVEGLGKTFPILFHTGDDRFDYSAPARLAKVAKKFPKATFIGAHFGGYRRWNEVGVYEGLNNVYFDTSSTLPFIGEQKAGELISKFGAEKFFFGTDFPMWDAVYELERFNKIRLTEKEREKILAGNLKNLLGIM